VYVGWVASGRVRRERREEERENNEIDKIGYEVVKWEIRT